MKGKAAGKHILTNNYEDRAYIDMGDYICTKVPASGAYMSTGQMGNLALCKIYSLICVNFPGPVDGSGKAKLLHYIEARDKSGKRYLFGMEYREYFRKID